MLTVSIDRDHDLEMPEQGFRLHSFNRNHTTFTHPDAAPVASPLSAWVLDCYDHGDQTWSVAGEGHQCRWDTARGGGVLEYTGGELPTDDFYIEPEKRLDAGREWLKCYNSWANGDGLMYCVRDENDEWVDSCGGYYGCDAQYVYDTIAAVLAGRPWRLEATRSAEQDGIHRDGVAAAVAALAKGVAA